MPTTNSLQTIKSLVGETITKENLKFIDSFVSQKLAVFMPIGGSCGYATTPDHTHPSYMFVLSYDAETEVVIDGKTISSMPNTMFCLSPHIKHHEVQHYLPPKYSAIFIEKEFFESCLESYHDSSLYLDGKIIQIKNQKIELYLKEFIQETQNNLNADNILLENLATLLTHQIIRNLLEYPAPSQQISDNLIIQNAIKYINTDFEKEILLKDLAKKSHLSKSQFSKIFTKEMGISPMQYLTTVRLQQAKKMLRSKELSISQVSSLCGFNSSAYFAKLFKEHFSLTPKEYLKRQI